MVYSAKELCERLNLSPLIRKRGLILTPKTLKELGFKEKEFDGSKEPFYLLEIDRRFKESGERKKQKLLKKADRLTDKEKKAYKKVIDILSSEWKLGRKEPSQISFITMFRFIPLFNNWVSQARYAFKFTPQQLRRELNKNFPTKEGRAIISGYLDNDYKMSRKIYSGWKTDEEARKYFELTQKIIRQDIARFPHIRDYLRTLRDALPFIFEQVSYDFRNYVVYGVIGRVSPESLNYKISHSPEIEFVDNIDEYEKRFWLFEEQDDDDNFEPRIILTMYPDTPINEVKKRLGKKDISDFQKSKPSYKFKYNRLAKQDYKKFLGKLIFFYLKNKEGLSSKEANRVIKKLGFNEVPLRIIDREKKRLEELLETSLSSMTQLEEARFKT